MRVGVDLDGVVFSYVDALRRDFGFTPDEAPDPFKWELWECWGMSAEEFQAKAEESYERHLFFRGEPYDYAIEGLQELKSLGHSLHIITARHHPVARRDTVAWLEEYGIDYDSLTFTEDKTCVPVDVIVEDNLDNAEACLAAGTKAFLFDRPWNQGDTEVPRVITMCDFVAETQHVQSERCREEEGQGPPLERRVTSPTGGQKGQKAEQMSLLPVESLMEISRVFAFGSEKYERENWRKGYDFHLAYDAMQRHLNRYWGGETIDPESGCHHLAHAAFHTMILMAFDAEPERYKQFDDRNPTRLVGDPRD